MAEQSREAACPDCGHADRLHFALGHVGCHDLACLCERVAPVAQLPRIVADVLARHQRIVTQPGGPCWCGEWPTADRDATWIDHVGQRIATVVEIEHIAGRVMSAKAEQRAEDWDAEKRARALAGVIDRCTAHMRDVLGYADDQPDAGLESLVVQAKHLRTSPDMPSADESEGSA